MDTGWELWGLKFHWLLVLLIIVVLAFVIYLAKKKTRPPKADKGAGDEGL